MDQDNPSQSQTQDEHPKPAADASTAPVAQAEETAPAASDPTTAKPVAPSRPRRPQRGTRVEGSVDISEPKVEPKAEPAPPPVQEESSPDGVAASRPKPSRPAAARPPGDRPVPGIKPGAKGHGHHPVRAASVPHPPASRAVPPHLNPHSQRALSVAGTADTQAQTVEDFRQVPASVCSHVSTCLTLHLIPENRERFFVKSSYYYITLSFIYLNK